MSSNVFKRTKILATIGPATFSQEKVFQLLDAGVNGIRMNFSHGDNESRLEQINWVRTASQRLGKPVAILQDLQGPKIRLGILKDNMLNVKAGDMLVLDSEIAERVAILKRFRSLLEEQRLKFREYLTVLEKQEKSISAENTEAVLQHTELEESIIAEIFTIQKVIDPLEYMYANICKNTEHSDIPHLKTDLDDLQKRVLAQNKKNRELLQTHITGLRQQIASLKRPYAHKESIYAGTARTATIVDFSL